jgi:hypothetical protein
MIGSPSEGGAESERTQEPSTPSSFLNSLLVAIVVIAVLGAVGYLYYLFIHDLSMIMLGQMRAGYENFLLGHVGTEL